MIVIKDIDGSLVIEGLTEREVRTIIYALADHSQKLHERVSLDTGLMESQSLVMQCVRDYMDTLALRLLAKLPSDDIDEEDVKAEPYNAPITDGSYNQ